MGSGSTKVFKTSCSSVLMERLRGGGILEPPTVRAPVVICVLGPAKFRGCGILHLFPFDREMLVVVNTSGGGLGDRPPTAV